jgi:Holliday junction resolvase
MGKKSKSKGARGEREAAKALSDIFNVEAYRGRQYPGSPQSPDIVAMPELHFEVKRSEAFQLYPSLTQATNDAGNSIPVVLHRRNRKKWVIVAYLEDLPEISNILRKYELNK